jgi:hypothetical protein
VSPHKLTEQWRLLGGVLSPERYPAWTRFAREVSKREGSVTLTLDEGSQENTQESTQKSDQEQLKATPSAQGAAHK